MPLSPRFWIANRVTVRLVDLAFRAVSADVLNATARNRFLYGGIGAPQLGATLKRVRGVAGWPLAWAETGRDYLQAARAAERRGERLLGAELRAAAALCYHFGQLFELQDIARKRDLYGRAAALFRQAAPLLRPAIEPVEIPWRDLSLPAYLRCPEGDAGPYPLVVLLNGASTVKEETTRWSRPLLKRGFATLALDTPGSGEAWDRVLGRPGQEDIADALLAFGEAHPALDARRVAVLGISLRGALAVQMAAHDERLAAAISVTAPFHPATYFRHLSELVTGEIAHLTGAESGELSTLVARMSLVDVAPRLRSPLLVIGAGNDLVVPPRESLRLYQAAGGPKRLHFIPKANHVAFSHMEEWLAVAGSWLGEVFAQRGRPALPA